MITADSGRPTLFIVSCSPPSSNNPLFFEISRMFGLKVKVKVLVSRTDSRKERSLGLKSLVLVDRLKTESKAKPVSRVLRTLGLKKKEEAKIDLSADVYIETVESSACPQPVGRCLVRKETSIVPEAPAVKTYPKSLQKVSRSRVLSRSHQAPLSRLQKVPSLASPAASPLYPNRHKLVRAALTKASGFAPASPSPSYPSRRRKLVRPGFATFGFMPPRSGTDGRHRGRRGASSLLLLSLPPPLPPPPVKAPRARILKERLARRESLGLALPASHDILAPLAKKGKENEAPRNALLLEPQIRHTNNTVEQGGRGSAFVWRRGYQFDLAQFTRPRILTAPTQAMPYRGAPAGRRFRLVRKSESNPNSSVCAHREEVEAVSVVEGEQEKFKNQTTIPESFEPPPSTAPPSRSGYRSFENVSGLAPPAAPPSHIREDQQPAASPGAPPLPPSPLPPPPPPAKAPSKRIVISKLPPSPPPIDAAASTLGQGPPGATRILRCCPSRATRHSRTRRGERALARLPEDGGCEGEERQRAFGIVDMNATAALPVLLRARQNLAPHRSLQVPAFGFFRSAQIDTLAPLQGTFVTVVNPDSNYGFTRTRPPNFDPQAQNPPHRRVLVGRRLRSVKNSANQV
ncbi:hypothetical protein K438DRAFT_2014560 [Mycena galopus ATCC 62051]|nr:hypothetical protein K438DRAFT_2014560 [Mycena galopus ATCC 62051]